MTVATKYLPEVAWRTIAKNVTVVALQTPTTQAVFNVTCIPTDINEPGAPTAEKKIGYYLKDYVGHTYRISAIDVGSNPDRIEVVDDFRVGVGPQIERPAIIYKSVGWGVAPYLAPIKLHNLDQSARDYSNAIELAILYKPKRRIPFTDSATPGIINYQSDQVDPEDITKMVNYAKEFEEDPRVKCIITIDSTHGYERQQNMLIGYDANGLIDSISFELQEILSGFIQISKP